MSGRQVFATALTSFAGILFLLVMLVLDTSQEAPTGDQWLFEEVTK